MTNIADITIIGGGIMGMLTARELRMAGANVTLIEQGQIGRESSWAGGGILLPIYPWRQEQAITDLVIQSLKLYPGLIETIKNNSGIDPEFLQSGMLICKNPDARLAKQWCEKNSIQYELPSREMLATVQTQYVDPLWLPEIHQARNPRLLKAVHAELIASDVKFIPQCELLKLNTSSTRIDSISTSAGTFPVGQLVISAGAWTGDLWRQLFPAETVLIPKIEPVKGQMLLFDAKPDTLMHMVLDGPHYLIPRLDGKILVGSTVESSGYQKTTTSETRQQLSDFAQILLPSLREYPIIAHWAGLRPGTQQGIPYITRHPVLKNLSLNAGHFRNGLTMAPASAQLLADLILNRPTSINPTPYQFNSVH
jgi:glycine oxidase